MRYVFAAPFVFLVTLALLFQSSFCVQRIYAWHLVPLGLPPVTWQVVAAAMLIRGVVMKRAPQNEPADSRTEKEQVLEWLVHLVSPWLALGLAWAIR